MQNLFGDMNVILNFNTVYIMKKDVRARYGILASVINTCTEFDIEVTVQSV